MHKNNLESVCKSYSLNLVVSSTSQMRKSSSGEIKIIRLNNYIPEIRINLDNGVYLFSNDSVGKTRLYKELRKNQMYKENVASYSYNDYLINIPIESVLIPNKYKVVMLDRYDMYNGVGKDLISACKNNTIVLIDCKKGLNFGVDYEFCYLEMTDSLMEVS